MDYRASFSGRCLSNVPSDYFPSDNAGRKSSFVISGKSVEFEPATCWMIQVYSATSTGTVQCFTGSNASLFPLNMIRKKKILGNEEFWLKNHTLHFSPLMK